MPDAATIKEIVGGGIGFGALAVLAVMLWIQWKERTATMDSIKEMVNKASDAIDRNTAAVSKLETAVQKLEIRLDEHDQILFSDRKHSA